MTYRSYIRAMAYENKVRQQPEIPDAKLCVGAAEFKGSIPLNLYHRKAPGAAKVSPIKTNDDLRDLKTGKKFTQADFQNSGYYGEAL